MSVTASRSPGCFCIFQTLIQLRSTHLRIFLFRSESDAWKTDKKLSKKKKKKGFCDDNTINVTIILLMYLLIGCRSDLVQLRKIVTTLCLIFQNCWLLIYICSFIHQELHNCSIFLERSLMFIYYHNLHAWILNAFRLQYFVKVYSIQRSFRIILTVLNCRSITSRIAVLWL